MKDPSWQRDQSLGDDIAGKRERLAFRRADLAVAFLPNNPLFSDFEREGVFATFRPKRASLSG
ncbi:MAG: hypothetical protein FJ257_12340 [Phycisphaerae bacterium]|nr:hypothetical protein [Phycisphaerae bacterium]